MTREWEAVQVIIDPELMRLLAEYHGMLTVRAELVNQNPEWCMDWVERNLPDYSLAADEVLIRLLKKLVQYPAYKAVLNGVAIDQETEATEKALAMREGQNEVKH